MKLKIILIIILLSLFGCTSNSEVDLTYFNSAIRELNDLKYSESLVDLKKSINENPSHFESYSYSANILINKKKYNEAYNILKIGIDNVSEKEEMYTLLGRTRFLSHNYSESEDYFHQALKINPRNSEAFTGYVVSKSRQEKHSELAQIALDYLDKQNSDDFKIISTLLLVDTQKEGEQQLSMLGKLLPMDDLDLLKEVISNNDQSIERYMKISRVMINLGYPSFSIPYLNKTIEKNEFYEGGYLFKGIVLIKLDRIDEGKTLIQKALTINQNLPEAYIYLAKANIAEEDLEGANLNFQKALELSNDENILFEYYQSTKATDPNAHVIDLLDELRKLNPNKTNYSMLLAEQYCINDGYIDELTKLLDSINSEDLDNLDQEKFKILRACLSYREGNIDLAIKNINEVLLINKNQLLGYYIEALIASENQNPQFEDIKNRILDSDLDGYYTTLVKQINV